MRLYSFTNYYLSPIQQGIQPAHCVADMFIKYADPSIHAAMTLHEWAADHKTMVCLNGGNAQGVRDAFAVLARAGEQLNLPFGCFYEDQQSLDGTMTCCAIVVPEELYAAAAKLRNSLPGSLEEREVVTLYTGADLDLIVLIRHAGLAR